MLSDDSFKQIFQVAKVLFILMSCRHNIRVKFLQFWATKLHLAIDSCQTIHYNYTLTTTTTGFKRVLNLTKN